MKNEHSAVPSVELSRNLQVYEMIRVGCVRYQWRYNKMRCNSIRTDTEKIRQDPKMFFFKYRCNFFNTKKHQEQSFVVTSGEKPGRLTKLKERFPNFFSYLRSGEFLWVEWFTNEYRYRSIKNKTYFSCHVIFNRLRTVLKMGWLRWACETVKIRNFTTHICSNVNTTRANKRKDKGGGKKN